MTEVVSQNQSSMFDMWARLGLLIWPGSIFEPRYTRLVSD